MEGRAMDGMLTTVVGEIVRDDGPSPFVCSDAEALRAVSAAHAAQMAREAGEIARRCQPRTAFDPAEAARAAELYHRQRDQRRVFHADRLRGLRDAGRLTQAQYVASVEIGDLITWIEAGKQVIARSQFSERLAASTSTVALHQRLEEAERLRYGPWRAWASAFPVKPARSLEDLVRAFVAQGLGVEQAGRAFCMHRQRAEALLVRGLARYAQIAGWEAAPQDA
jgi:hypothetical protein